MKGAVVDMLMAVVYKLRGEILWGLLAEPFPLIDAVLKLQGQTVFFVQVCDNRYTFKCIVHTVYVYVCVHCMRGSVCVCGCA